MEMGVFKHSGIYISMLLKDPNIGRLNKSPNAAAAALNCPSDPCKLTLDTMIWHWACPTISMLCSAWGGPRSPCFQTLCHTHRSKTLNTLQPHPGPVTMGSQRETWIWTSHHDYLYGGSLSATTSKEHCHILCPRWHQSPGGAATHPHHQHG